MKIHGHTVTFCLLCLFILVWMLFVHFIHIFWPHHLACGMLVPRPGNELMPHIVEAQSLSLGHQGFILQKKSFQAQILPRKDIVGVGGGLNLNLGKGNTQKIQKRAGKGEQKKVKLVPKGGAPSVKVLFTHLANL